MTNEAGEKTHEGAHVLEAAEGLLTEAEHDPTKAQPAAVAAMRSLLLFWGETPRGFKLADLLAQAAETDETLAERRSDALTLDADTAETPGDAYERAKEFVDAARGRIDNI